MTTKAEMENMAANIGRALGTSVYYWKESGVHSFYPGDPASRGRSMKLLGEYSAPKLYEAGEKFLDGFYKGAGCLVAEREKHAEERKAWEAEKNELHRRMKLLEKAIEGAASRQGHSSVENTLPKL
ncbi:MAG: hypothetical protein J0L89_00625 [Xanthomonadales bacterium]|nr:hypothetical protein [Xanthomonadales bacterium]